jgi:hypothetical protein
MPLLEIDICGIEEQFFIEDCEATVNVLENESLFKISEVLPWKRFNVYIGSLKICTDPFINLK